MELRLSEVLTSSQIIDLPPRTYYEFLTPDQKDFWLQNKFYWTEIYAALTRYFCGKPIKAEYWDKATAEMFMSHLDRYLALYKLINFGWHEIKASNVLEDKIKSPGELLLLLLKLESIARLLPCIEGASFSPQVRYRARRKYLKGEGDPFATEGQKTALELQNYSRFEDFDQS